MTERTPRKIRMNDEEWEAFKKHLGPAWLRRQIIEAIVRNNMKGKE